MSDFAHFLSDHSWQGFVLMTLFGAWLGGLLGALLRHIAHASGYPSSHDQDLESHSRCLARLPIVGHLALPRPARSRRALALECATASAFALCWALFPPAKAACGALFIAALIGASTIDLDQMILPDLFTIGLALAGLALSAAVPSLHGIAIHSPIAGMRSLASGLLGMGIGSALALWISVTGEWILEKEVLGFGDVKFLGAIGAFCGWQGAVFSLFGGACFGACAIVAAEAHRRLFGESSVQLFRVESSSGEGGKIGWGACFPFGPMLAVAAAAYFLGLHGAVDRFLACYAALF
jgi:leader peptidase (prepilin peptidase)/N-methyltransferase